ncbi:MAG: hypothetical protein LBQ88_06305 [Treponema sp.]|nr:hypothetical protein [Treponema sp.]
MPGYFHRRPAKEVLDKLAARALVANDGKNVIAVAAVDHIGLSRETVNAAKARVRELAGIEPENVLIGCSHIHQGGPYAGDELKQDKDYAEFVINRIADTIVLASQRLKPAELYFGDGKLEGYSFCRIYNMEGGGLQTNPFGMNTKSSISEKHRTVLGPYRDIDKSVHVVDIRVNGKTAGVLVNFTCHCDVVGSETAVSADFPGELRRCIKEKYGQDTAVLYLQGPCGNINHIDAFHVEETKHSTRYLEMGRALAEEAMRIMAQAAPAENTDVRAAGEDVDIPLKIPSGEQVAWAEKTIAAVKEDLKSLCEFDHDQVDLFFAKKIRDEYKRQEKSRKIFLQAIQIGELCIYASPGELFSEYGDEIIAGSPFKRKWVAAYSNDQVGYIVAPDCMVPGVYEARQTIFPPEGGAMMNKELLRLGNTLI